VDVAIPRERLQEFRAVLADLNKDLSGLAWDAEA
jgi:hypothetical protein